MFAGINQYIDLICLHHSHIAHTYEQGMCNGSMGKIEKNKVNGRKRRFKRLLITIHMDHTLYPVQVSENEKNGMFLGAAMGQARRRMHV